MPERRDLHFLPPGERISDWHPMKKLEHKTVAFDVVTGLGRR